MATGFESDGWNYRTKPDDNGNCRKLVTLHDHGMMWVGVRAWYNTEQRWYNGNEPEHHTVHAWRELPAPAEGFWQHGQLHGLSRS
jgi:hypothetical protein